MSGAYTIGRFRRSFKRDGRLGIGWMVSDEASQTAIAKVDTEEQARAVVEAMARGVDRHDTEALRAIVRAAHRHVPEGGVGTDGRPAMFCRDCGARLVAGEAVAS